MLQIIYLEQIAPDPGTLSICVCVDTARQEVYLAPAFGGTFDQSIASYVNTLQSVMSGEAPRLAPCSVPQALGLD